MENNMNLSLDTKNRMNDLKQEINFKSKIEQDINLTRDKLYKAILHDLRNPVCGIQALSELIEQKINSNLSDNLDQIVNFNQMIIKASESLLSLLEEFQTLLQSEVSESRKTFSLFSLIPSIISSVSPIRSKKSIYIEYNFASNDTVFGNEILASVILRNLLTNAIKFTNILGKIILSTQIKDSFLEISVQDTGVGITDIDLKKLFEIDTKFTTIGTTNEIGTGLGLILCKEFVEAQGGKIWAESEFGVGSKFTFSLPLGESKLL